ncbi:MAG: DUF2264 domain-containing protein [Candidatus Glassbacteria bacterium]|nr:DUF2264 domain-containing protein [Candidatus Glassbacteria bacterium]
MKTSTEDKYTGTIVSWLRGLTEPLGEALAGRGEALLSHPTRYGALSDRLESFSRPLLAAAPWLSGRAVASLPEADSFARAARQTILRCTDPAHRDYWGEMQDFYQPVCEASAVAWCLHNARAALWEPLSRAERDQVARWLADVQGRKVSDSNWHLFPAVVQAFLEREGYPVDRNELKAHFDRVFGDFYAGGGWYRDGDEPAFDTYNGNMIQPYFQMLDELGAFPECSEELQARSVEFCNSLLEFFDEEGVAPFWGRSAVYRLNYLDGTAMALRRGLEVKKPGDWRRAVAGACRYLPLEAVTGPDRLLLAGFLGKKEDVLDDYSCRASAYWMGRNCHFLQVPAGSPFWQEEPAPWQGGLRHLAPLPIALNRRSRHVVVWNLGLSHHAYAASKYHNLLFSGRFGQVYGGGAAALFYRREGSWLPFHSWKPVQTTPAGALVCGQAGEAGLEVAFEVAPETNGNLLRVINRSGGTVEVRLGSFAVSGKAREVPEGLAGAEGTSVLRPVEGFGRPAVESGDCIHIWAGTFSYPAARATLPPGDTAAAELDGIPGDWDEVLKLHGGEKASRSG